MYALGWKLVNLRNILGVPKETEFEIINVLSSKNVFDAKTKEGVIYRFFRSDEGRIWEFKEDERIIKDSSDLTYLEAKDLHQLQHAAVIINDRNWFEEIGKEIKKLKNELECLQNGYKQRGIEW